MGGWGPFTVREIANLFEEHGFEESVEVEPEQGVRRTTAAEYLAAVDWDDASQRGRVLDLGNEVLEYYPEAEDAGHPGRPGPRLRRALSRVAGELEQRLEDVTGEDTGATFERTTDEDDPFDVWPPERIRLFFSHTSAHKQLVGAIAGVLEKWPFACFVAHEEIEPSLAWQEVIESALATCHALVAFITEDFRMSAWCDQEVGWALGRGLVVIPVRLTSNPHGFTGAIQAVPGSASDAPERIAERIAAALSTAVFRGTRPGSAMMIDALADAVITQFCSSGSFDLTRKRFEFLRRIPRPLWTPERRIRVDTACNANGQIREAGLDDGRPVPDAVRALWE
jgi:TIR domain